MLIMTTLQSWQTIIVCVVIAAALMWVVYELDKVLNARATKKAETAPEAKPARHLSLVPPLSEPAPQPLYDWEKQGI